MSDLYEKIGELRDQLNDALEALRNIWDLTQPLDPYLLIRAEVVKGLGCAAPSGMEMAQREAPTRPQVTTIREIMCLGLSPNCTNRGRPAGASLA